MPCITCGQWLAPTRGGKPQVGTCLADNNASHAYYHCTRFVPITASQDTADLTLDEIAFLREHRDTPAGTYLIGLYNKIVADTEDPRARQLFEIALRKWRTRREGRKPA